MEACRAHNPKVNGSNPLLAIQFFFCVSCSFSGTTEEKDERRRRRDPAAKHCHSAVGKGRLDAQGARVPCRSTVRPIGQRRSDILSRRRRKGGLGRRVQAHSPRERKDGPDEAHEGSEESERPKSLLCSLRETDVPGLPSHRGNIHERGRH